MMALVRLLTIDLYTKYKIHIIKVPQKHTETVIFRPPDHSLMFCRCFLTLIDFIADGRTAPSQHLGLVIG